MKETYQRMNAQINPGELLVHNAMHPPRKSRNLKPIAIGLTCAVLSMGSISVLAHASETFRDALYAISPRAGALFNPVMKSCTSEGIEMTVEGVYINDDDTEIYITFKDLEGSRLSRNVDLFDSYAIIRPFSFDGSAYGCVREGYDEEKEVYRFHIYANEPGAGKFWGDSMTFSVKTLLTDVEVQEHVPVDINLSDVNYQPQTIPGKEFFSSRGYSGGGKYIPDTEKINVIKPEYQKDFIRELKLTGLAWENGWLHIQNYVEHWNGNSSIGYYLMDENGNEIEEEFSINWRDGDGEYMEGFFAVNAEEIENYTVYADYRAGGELIEGNWNIKFPLENTQS